MSFGNETPEQIRADQVKEARRRTLTVVRPAANTAVATTAATAAVAAAEDPKWSDVAAAAPRRDSSTPASKAHKPKGHDRILDTAQRSGKPFTVVLAGMDTPIVGKLVGRDKFTVTVEGDDGIRRTIFKHAIDMFFEGKAA